MKKRISFFLVALLTVAAIGNGFATDIEDENDEVGSDVSPSAMLLVRSKLSTDTPQVGKIMTVTVEVHNAGTTAATDVSVVESEWEPDAFLIEGTMKESYKMIPAGATESFSYSLTPKHAFVRYEQKPSSLTYRPTENGNLISVEGFPLTFSVFSTSDVLIARALRVGSVISLGMLNSQKQWTRFTAILGGSALVYMLLGMYRAAATARQNRNRQKYLREFGIDDEKTK